jgi:hypothetical protein
MILCIISDTIASLFACVHIPGMLFQVQLSHAERMEPIWKKA